MATNQKPRPKTIAEWRSERRKKAKQENGFIRTPMEMWNGEAFHALSKAEKLVLLEVAGWLKPIITMLYYTGMRPSEVLELDWKEVDFGRRMIVLPPTRTKEGKNANQKWLREKRAPMRKEVHDLLWRLRHEDGENVVRLSGRVFIFEGRPIARDTKRKCWARIIRLTCLDGYQMKDLRRAFKTSLAWSGVDRTIRNAIVGHSSHVPVEDRYIHLTDERLLEAVDSMGFERDTNIPQAGDLSKVTKE